MSQARPAEPAVVVEALRKSFGTTVAVDGIDLEVAPGTVFGLLGPNGAGKTTTVRILTTLLAPDAGVVRVAGFDVVRDAHRVRASIGLSGQFAAVGDRLTGFENLEMIGRLLGLSRRDARRRADEVLDRFDLTDAGRRLAATYSGGMRRRLDLAASLVGRPPVLFLDEPTTGLDPRSRLELWAVVRELVAEGTTVLLTTQYLEEADALSHQVAVVDRGRVIARGTPAELKAQAGGKVLKVQPADPAALGVVAAVLGGRDSQLTVDADTNTVTVAVGDDIGVVAAALRRLDDAGVALSDAGVHRPTLDDVFLALTGRPGGDDRGRDAGVSADGRPA